MRAAWFLADQPSSTARCAQSADHGADVAAADSHDAGVRGHGGVVIPTGNGERAIRSRSHHRAAGPEPARRAWRARTHTCVADRRAERGTGQSRVAAFIRWNYRATGFPAQSDNRHVDRSDIAVPGGRPHSHSRADLGFRLPACLVFPGRGRDPKTIPVFSARIAGAGVGGAGRAPATHTVAASGYRSRTTPWVRDSMVQFCCDRDWWLGRTTAEERRAATWNQSAGCRNGRFVRPPVSDVRLQYTEYDDSATLFSRRKRTLLPGTIRIGCE